MKYLKGILLMALIANIQLGWAQLSPSFTVSSYVDDNVYRSPEAQGDLLSDFSLRLNYTPEQSDFTYFINGNYFTYAQNPERNFYINDLGVNYVSVFGSQKNHYFFAGADWLMRLNGADYNYYDYNQLFAYFNFRFNFSNYLLKTGYNFRYRSYSNLSALDNTRHYLFMQINRALPTRTTLIFEADLGYKSFAGQTVAVSGTGGRGRGRMFYEPAYTETQTIPSLSHFIYLMRVAQSLHDRLGIYVQYRQQINLSSNSGYQNSEGYFQDEELFDDPFSYESKSITSQLTWLMPYFVKLQVGGGILNKQYISEQAYVSASDTVGNGGLREDDRRFGYVRLSKTFKLKQSVIDQLRFNLEYNLVINKSNSYWYDYKNNLLGASLQIGF